MGPTQAQWSVRVLQGRMSKDHVLDLAAGVRISHGEGKVNWVYVGQAFLFSPLLQSVMGLWGWRELGVLLGLGQGDPS